MDHQKLEEALDQVLARDPRFHRAAYSFLRDALDYTLKPRKKSGSATSHVSGQELLEGVRQHALKTFGPMVPTVFEYWGVRTTEDFGAIVFNLVDSGILGKTERDSVDDFKDAYTFQEAFVEPFIPRPPAPPPRQITIDSPAEELN